MYEYQCRDCGRIHYVKRKKDIRKHCPGGCGKRPPEPVQKQPGSARKSNAMTPTQVCGVTVENYDRTLKWEQGSSGRWICPYAANVACYRRSCSTCGWHPQVAEERRNRILNRMGVRM